jgi:hypothetical protein
MPDLLRGTDQGSQLRLGELDRVVPQPLDIHRRRDLIDLRFHCPGA